MMQVCRAFGILRKIGCKIFNGYKEQGPEALGNRSPARVRQIAAQNTLLRDFGW